jgi:hypothetical protein
MVVVIGFSLRVVRGVLLGQAVAVAVAVAGGVSRLLVWELVAGASDGLGGQQRERHHGACGGDTGGDVVGGVEPVEEG